MLLKFEYCFTTSKESTWLVENYKIYCATSCNFIFYKNKKEICDPCKNKIQIELPKYLVVGIGIQKTALFNNRSVIRKLFSEVRLICV